MNQSLQLKHGEISKIIKSLVAKFGKVCYVLYCYSMLLEIFLFCQEEKITQKNSKFLPSGFSFHLRPH